MFAHLPRRKKPLTSRLEIYCKDEFEFGLYLTLFVAGEAFTRQFLLAQSVPSAFAVEIPPKTKGEKNTNEDF